MYPDFTGLSKLLLFALASRLKRHFSKHDNNYNWNLGSTVAPAITFIKFWVLDVHYFPLQYCENTVKNVGCCWFSHNNIFVFFVMMLFVTKISLFVFLLCFSCPLWRSHGCRRYLLPTHPHTLPVAFQLAPKIYFRHFGYFYILGGGGADYRKIGIFCIMAPWCYPLV